MKVSYERLFHRGIFGRFAAFLYFVLAVVVPLRAVADTGLPPPQTPNQAISQASSSDSLRYGRIGPSASWDVESNRIKPLGNPQFNGSSRTSGGHVGNKTLNVNFRDNFGNSAGGQIQTQTRTPGSSTLSKAVGAYAAGSIAGSVLGSSNAQKAAGYLAKAVMVTPPFMLRPRLTCLTSAAVPAPYGITFGHLTTDAIYRERLGKRLPRKPVMPRRLPKLPKQQGVKLTKI